MWRIGWTELMRLMLAAMFGLVAVGPAQAQAPQRDLNSHCPFEPPVSLEQWEHRATELKLQLQVALGLLPFPTLDPVQPQIYGRRAMDGYSVEKCIFESLPGLWVTGTLYRPLDVPAGAALPGVLCPHGHWANGRFYEANDVAQQLASGGERWEAAAINPMQARCVQLARMGCVVYQYDMIGYADSRQISFGRAHGFAAQAADQEVTDEGWLLFSPLAESHAQSIMGLQTLATWRAVDMLLSLPDIDPRRIGITGASGGGTQSFIAAALDSRLAVAFPAVMVSTGMQGGCTCENSCLLRTGTGNVEIAALFAPKPLGLTAANDWTRTMPSDGFPQLQQVYAMYGQKEAVALFPSLHFGHNYNHVSRVSMYGWMNDHFELGGKQPILETDFERLAAQELTVWDDEHPQPPGGLDFERRLMKLWSEITELQLIGLLQGDRQQQSELAGLLRDGWRVVLGLTTGAARPTDPAVLNEIDDPSGSSSGITVEHGDRRWHYEPQSAEQPLVDYKRLAASYTYGFNLSQFARQAQQLGLSLRQLADKSPSTPVMVSGRGSDGALAAAAVFCAEQSSLEEGRPVSIQLSLGDVDFRFAQAATIRSAEFLPGAARFLDFPGLVACLSSAPRWSDDSDPSPFERLARLRTIRVPVEP